MTFASAIPAIISGGIAERAKSHPFLIGSAKIVVVVYPFFKGLIWNVNFDFQV
jgi:Amt family ammonium transporter